MIFRSRLALLILLLSFGVLSACGDGSGTTLEGFAASESQPAGVEITGIVANLPESQSLLVFAFLRSGENASDEPVSVGIVDGEGQFALSGLPPGKVSLTFLVDGANDGVIDPGDTITHLVDPDQQLEGLQDSDQVHLLDIHLDFNANRAVADAIEVTRADATAAPPTPTPTE
jgi:hypothetical protein